MYNQKKMYAAMRNFKWADVVAMLTERTRETLKCVLADVNRSGCLIRLHAISALKDACREQFVHSLRQFATDIGGASAAAAVDYILTQVELTELALAEIEGSFDSDPFAHQRPETQAWA